MLKPYGIIPALVTPMTEAGEVNETALRGLVRRMLDHGVHGLFCLGTNGEFFALDEQEKLTVAEIIVEEAAGAVPVYAGSGGIGTRETIALTRKLEKVGVDAVSVITPYFLKFSQRELAAHYRELAAASRLPIVLYNIPGLTGNALLPATVGELAKIDSIAGIKDSSGSFDNMLQYLDATDDDFAVLAGTDSLILSVLLAGGQGAIAATANVFPGAVVGIYERWRSGDIAGAESEQRKLRGLREAFGLGTLPSVLKEALEMAGVPAGAPRKPVQPLQGEARQRLRAVMEAYRDRGEL
ncbi:4-hydroxy-tetrahydrodipicolinate synthase [Cohnella cellulosilytica]|uniref:4-hydroxy-tetrahydrodipicolinate synthase n=1 Tax=Cohnella cellulosilytica TaxID=986710 RepID=A0ABW2FCG3_9BACL